MKRFILAVCALAAFCAMVWTATALEGQDDPSEPSLEPRLDLLAEPSVIDSDSELRELRELYIEVTRINAARMTADELRAALEAAQVQHREHQANSRLQEAIEIISEVVTTYPDSHAAAAARLMLECAAEGRGRVPSRDPGASSSDFDEPLPTRPTF